MRRHALILPAALLASCGTWDEHELSTLAEVCVQDDELRVTFDDCRSSSCSQVVDSGCTATLDGDLLTVRGGAIIEVWNGPGACTADCAFTTAWCALPTGVDMQRTRLAYGTDPGSATLAESGCNDGFWGDGP